MSSPRFRVIRANRLKQVKKELRRSATYLSLGLTGNVANAVAAPASMETPGTFIGGGVWTLEVS